MGGAPADDVATTDAGLEGDGPDGPQLHTRRADLQGRTPNQQVYLRNILDHDVTFGIGPAGTGKTFLAVACAVDALERSSVQRIVLTRPAVEAGEKLGFLPGDLGQKVDPYLRPLYDALYDLMGFDRVQKAFERNAIEIAPQLKFEERRRGKSGEVMILRDPVGVVLAILTYNIRLRGKLGT